MNTNSVVAGSFHENFINYQLIYLRKIKVIPGGTAIVLLDTSSPCGHYGRTMKAKQINKNFLVLPMEDF